jgi:ABC-type antimicrobial peptide transport system permease subunit
MGLTQGSHRAALVIELFGMLISALAIAVLFALAAARLMSPEIDPLPSAPPGPLFEVPWLLMLAALAGLVLVSIVGGVLANRYAERADFAKVMRLGA